MHVLPFTATPIETGRACRRSLGYRAEALRRLLVFSLIACASSRWRTDQPIIAAGVRASGVRLHYSVAPGTRVPLWPCQILGRCVSCSAETGWSATLRLRGGEVGGHGNMDSECHQQGWVLGVSGASGSGVARESAREEGRAVTGRGARGRRRGGDGNWYHRAPDAASRPPVGMRSGWSVSTAEEFASGWVLDTPYTLSFDTPYILTPDTP
jgi:hypothetical protein